MNNKRTKSNSLVPESSSSRKRFQPNNQETPLKRQQLSSRLFAESSNAVNESFGHEQTQFTEHKALGGFFFNKNDPKVVKLNKRFDSIPNGAPPTKYNSDLKVVKDSDTQRKFFASIIDYLRISKYGGIEPLNIRTLTSGQFQSIFKHLIQHIMPNHIPKVRFEDEVLEVIKELDYPLINMISPASLRSIGALHTNPAFFALLYWLTEFCKMYDKGRSKLDDLSKNEIETEQIFEQYAVDCYSAFMSGSNDFSVQNKRLNYICENIIKKNELELDEVSKSIQSIDTDIQLLDQEKDLLQVEKAKRDEYNRDILKYEKLLESGNAKLSKVSSFSVRLRNEIKKINEYKELVIDERESFLKYFAAQNITIPDIEHTISNRTELEKEIHEITERYDDAEKTVMLLEREISGIRKELENSIKIYNDDRLGDMITLQYNKDTTDLNVDIKNDILPQILDIEIKVKKDGNELLMKSQDKRQRIAELEEETFKLEKELKELNELIHRKQNMVKQVRETEEKRQDEFNMTKEVDEKRRLQMHDKSITSLRKLRKSLQDRKLKVIETEQKIQELFTLAKVSLSDFATKIIEGLERMKISNEKHTNTMMSKAETALNKFNKL